MCFCSHLALPVSSPTPITFWLSIAQTKHPKVLFTYYDSRATNTRCKLRREPIFVRRGKICKWLGRGYPADLEMLVTPPTRIPFGLSIAQTKHPKVLFTYYDSRATNTRCRLRREPIFVRRGKSAEWLGRFLGYGRS